MQKNLFTKYFTICVTLILSAILLLGSFLMVFAGQYFRNDKMEMLEQYAAQATGLTMAAYQQNNYLYLDEATLSSVYNVLANAAEVSIFLSDINGKVLLCTDDSIFVDPTMPLSEAVLQEALSGRFEDDARLDGAYRARHYTKAQKIGLPDGRTSGYVFVTASARSLTEFLGRILNIFLLSALTMVVIASIVIYFVTARMVRPLRDMLAATRSFSRGDYTVRVQVNSADEIGQLAQEFNHMAEALARNENMNRSFVANVSHELKTPMTTIAGFVDGILDGTIPQEQHGKYLAVVSVEVKRLSRMVRSMLDLAKIEAGEMKLNPAQFDMNGTVCQVIFSFETAIENKRLDIRGLDVDKVMVSADPDLMHQVVYNLIENAVKFVNEDGYIEVKYHTDNDRTLVAIRNSGAGIASGELPKVFERFYKTDRSRSQDKSGVGLGLYIVRTVIQLHGGEIHVSSKEGEYTEFAFSIPTQGTKSSQNLFRKNG
ncbi:MAG: HAMP domain-containing histidine kinase [Oscillospiraceae bacterium]|nr:HAMP domain-containing histidine kinase [Oscillospiraceae bacterium]